MLFIFASVSTSTYKFVCRGTLGRLRHWSGYAMTYVSGADGVFLMTHQ
jgi:hypothetical protein